jgi:hypothetical protein
LVLFFIFLTWKLVAYGSSCFLELPNKWIIIWVPWFGPRENVEAMMHFLIDLYIP